MQRANAKGGVWGGGEERILEKWKRNPESSVREEPKGESFKNYRSTLSEGDAEGVDSIKR